MKPAAPQCPADLLGREVVFRSSDDCTRMGPVVEATEGSETDVDVRVGEQTWSVHFSLCKPYVPAPPRRGRPPVDPSGRVSSHQINVRLEPCLFEDAGHMASDAGLTRGAWVRRLIVREIIGDPPDPAPF